MARQAEDLDLLEPWIETLHDRVPDAISPLVSELVRIWGFVGSQVLWMVSPFVDSPALTRLANRLEDPEGAMGTESHREE